MKDFVSSKAARRLINAVCLNRVRRGGNKLIGAGETVRVRSSIEMRGAGNTVTLGAGRMYRSRIYVEGSGNELVIGDGFTLLDTQIWILGDHCRITLGRAMHINRAELSAQGGGSCLTCGDETLLGGFVWLGNRANWTRLLSINAGDGCAVTIGRDSRIAEGTVIKSSDSHPIFDRATGAVVNPPREITIGDHVWVCPNALLLKGSALGDGCVLGAQSVLTADHSGAQNALLVGSPARVARENIAWRM